MMTARQYSISILTAFFVAFGLWFATTAIFQLSDAASLQRNNVELLATVSEKWILPDENADQSHRVRYSFIWESHSYTFERAVPPAVFRVAESGSTFQVNASPDDPALHEIYPGQLSNSARAKLNGGLLIAGFGVAIFLIGGGLQIFRRKKEADV